jgi:Penicillin-insensitive murein endopeptidase/Putative peptidoglycan binding domain
MYRLSGSVGQGGRNGHDDVQLVQKLLNKNGHLVDVGDVPEDGNLDDRTQAAIVAFQRRIVRLSAPDGRVDPRGRTWRILLGDQPHGATVELSQLTNTDTAGGFYTYENPDRMWGTDATLASIRKLAAGLITKGIVIGVGDISFAHGGRMPPHASHRRGVDADLRPQREDQARAPVTYTDPAYSRARTQMVVDEVHKDDNLEFIFFNDKDVRGVRPWEGHDNHLHLRFKE